MLRAGIAGYGMKHLARIAIQPITGFGFPLNYFRVKVYQWMLINLLSSQKKVH